MGDIWRPSQRCLNPDAVPLVGVFKQCTEDFRVTELDWQGCKVDLNHAPHPQPSAKRHKPNPPAAVAHQSLSQLLGLERADQLSSLAQRASHAVASKQPFSEELQLGQFEKPLRAAIVAEMKRQYDGLLNCDSQDGVLTAKLCDTLRCLLGLLDEPHARRLVAYAAAGVADIPLELTVDLEKQQRRAFHQCLRSKLSFLEARTEANRFVIKWKPQKPKKDQQQYFHFTMEKSGIESMAAVSRLAAACGVAASDFSVSGLKDKRGVTSQRVSVRGMKSGDVLRELELAQIRVGAVTAADAPLQLGAHSGNYFQVCRSCRKQAKRDAASMQLSPHCSSPLTACRSSLAVSPHWLSLPSLQPLTVCLSVCVFA